MVKIPGKMSVVDGTCQGSMVGHLEGELKSNYRVGSVYVGRHAIWREVASENGVYSIGKSSSVPPLIVGRTLRESKVF